MDDTWDIAALGIAPGKKETGTATVDAMADTWDIAAPRGIPICSHIPVAHSAAISGPGGDIVALRMWGTCNGTSIAAWNWHLAALRLQKAGSTWHLAAPRL